MALPAIALAGAGLGYGILTTPGTTMLFGGPSEMSRRTLVNAMFSAVRMLGNAGQIDVDTAMSLTKRIAVLHEKVGAGFTRSEEAILAGILVELGSHGSDVAGGAVMSQFRALGRTASDALESVRKLLS